MSDYFIPNDAHLDRINSIIENDFLSKEKQYQKIKKICTNYPFLDLNQSNYPAALPIHRACSRKNLKIVKLLMRYQADVNILSNDQYNMPPLCFALQQANWRDLNHQELVWTLLNQGADINFKSPLLWVARLNPLWIPPLLALGANPKVFNEHGRTPLLELIYFFEHQYLSKEVEQSLVEITSFMIGSGVELNYVDSRKVSALSLAIQNNFKRVAVLLLDSGAHVNPDGCHKVIKEAIILGNIDLLRKILSNGGCATAGLQYLLRRHFPFQEKSAEEERKIQCEIKSIFSVLIEYGANLNNHLEGWSYYTHPKVVQLMFKQGARREISIHFPKIALDEKRETELKSIVQTYHPVPKLSRLCMMHFFKNPKQLTAECKKKLPEELLEQLREIDLPEAITYQIRQRIIKWDL